VPAYSDVFVPTVGHASMCYYPLHNIMCNEKGRGSPAFFYFEREPREGGV